MVSPAPRIIKKKIPHAGAVKTAFPEFDHPA
jgi:hypothetical protein